MLTTVTIGELKQRAHEFAERLAGLKRENAPRFGAWYPYRSLSNFAILEALLGPGFDLASLAPDGQIIDIGAADGDVAFLLESVGFKTTIVDNAATNASHLEAARLLKSLLGSRTEIYDIDLDAQFALPVDVDLVLLLGVLYHLKNPFYVLEALSRRAKFCLLSTRIARFSADYKLDMRDYPVAYLLHASETNNDATNYWIFSEAGLQRLFERTGWRAEKFMTVGDRERSNPADSANDERAFCLLRSTRSRPSLRAEPNPVPGDADLGTTTLYWDTADGYVGEVYVSLDGAPEALFAQGAVGSMAAPFIRTGHTYVFTLYKGVSRQSVLATVTVAGG